ncbi:MAG: MBL fold metallo-hydrolase [Candidatus Colwellbacteria bacterium]|nr:MBL fold metallo-hydrolase [Candidatus Colwellbacteria bacterium]
MRYLSFSFSLLIGLNIVIWGTIAVHMASADLCLYFLDVGQGDSQLIDLPEGGKILIDGGPGKETSFRLSRVLPWSDKYIDLVLLTHAEKDHLGGLGDVIARHQVGAFLWSGQDAVTEDWAELRNILFERSIPLVQVGKGDRIIQGDSVLSVISPDPELPENPSSNERSLVLILESEDAAVLYTADISTEIENKLTAENDVNVDILKVAHHGSRFSTSPAFLEEASPAVAVIEVGDNNYDHPHRTTLQKLAMAGASIYRTDINGTISLLIRDGKIGVKVERQAGQSN